MTLSVGLLAAGEEAAWDAYVHAAPDATFFHLSGWRPVIEAAFGHKTYYLTARDGGAIAGVLPLTHIRSKLFGDSLISNAFCVFGGPLADHAEARQALVDESIRIASDLKVGHLELRSGQATQPGWVQRAGLYVNFRRLILASLDENMKAIPRKQRAMVRKGISNGLTSVVDDNVDRFHHLYAESVRNLGTPVFSRRYMRLLKEQFGKDCDVVTILNGSEPVAAVMNFYFRDQVLPYYGGGGAQARGLAANDFMYWEVMRRGFEKGCRIFDFGRSKVGTGSYAFKHHWGFEPEPITYEFLPVTAQEIPEINPLNPKYRAMTEVWSRLPLSISKWLGPHIVRQIG